jgi:pyruvate formate lyase activating enzyme
MVDYPGKLAATVFTGGCNLRCPFCHNALLVTRLNESPALTEDAVLDFLASRKGLLDAMVLSGGEPLIHPDAVDFLEKVRKLGFAIKVDTNGCYPDVLQTILERGLADYVAMDIKNRPEKYAETVGISGFSTKNVEKSLSLLRSSGIPYELRTTVVRQFHRPEDLEAIGKWLTGTQNYYLQNFVDSGDLVGTGVSGFTKEEMEALQKCVLPYIPNTRIRGI